MRLYRDLIGLRRRHPALSERGRNSFSVIALGESALALRRCGPAPQDTLLMIVNLHGALRLDLTARAEICAPAGLGWSPLLDTEDEHYGGHGPARLIERRVVEMDEPGALVLQAVA